MPEDLEPLPLSGATTGQSQGERLWLQAEHRPCLPLRRCKDPLLHPPHLCPPAPPARPACPAPPPQVLIRDLNPKTQSTQELYGYVNMATREWKDGCGLELAPTGRQRVHRASCGREGS